MPMCFQSALPPPAPSFPPSLHHTTNLLFLLLYHPLFLIQLERKMTTFKAAVGYHTWYTKEVTVN